MRKVIGIGETVLDIIFKKGQPVSAMPGGSTFNAIISLARAGVPTTLISEAGNDRVGQTIIDFLRENGTDASHVSVFPDSKSPVSLAFLDDNNDADYVFYKDHPHDRIEFAYPDIQSDDIVLFGSYYALNPVIRPQVVAFIEYAKSHGAVIYYDVNFRPAHKNEIMKVTPNLLENLDYADIVRGSHEDFLTLYNKDSADKVYNAEIAFYSHNFIYTDGPRPLTVFGNGSFKKQYDVPEAETVSTIGAGDNFNAGFIFGLINDGITKESLERGLSESQWDSIVKYALAFSADCCKDIDNYISVDFGKGLRI